MGLSLVVDPHEDTRALYSEFLQRSGWETVEAADGASALSLAASRPPHLLLTELRVPRIDGLTLIHLLKSDSNTAPALVVVITADARTEELESARRLGADLVFPKPADLAAVFQRVDALVRRHAALYARADATRVRVGDAIANSERTINRTKSLARSMGRYSTTTPPQPPPPLVCSNCDAPLVYRRSFIGGVNEHRPEQWDYFECPGGCGQFQYRQRTRKLRKVQD